MSRQSYQFIPTQVYEEDARRKKADAWAEQHRAELAQQWRDLHDRDYRDLLAQHGLDDQGAPAPPPTSGFNLDTSTAASPTDSVPPPSPAPLADALQKVGDAEPSPPPDFADVMQKATLPGEGISDAAMTRTVAGDSPAPDDTRPPTPDLPGLPTLGGGMVLPGKATQNPDEARRKILAGEPLTAQDFVGNLTNQAQNQMSSTPAAAEGQVPGVHAGSNVEDIGSRLPKTTIWEDIANLGKSAPKAAGDLASMGPAERAAAGYAGDAIKPAEAAAQDATATSRFFHGTGSAFDRPDAAKFDPNGLYGPGYYLTDSPVVAGSGDIWNKGYAEKRANPVLAERDLNVAQGDLERVTRDLEHNYLDSPIRRGLLQQKTDLEQRIASLVKAPGPNVRAVDVPERLNLLDAEAPATAQDVQRVAAALPPDQRGYFLNGVKPYAEQGRLTGHDVYEWVQNSTLDPKATNAALSQAGYDGVQYAGGKRIPMTDDAGAPIEHQAVVVFPSSMEKLTNAISGTPFGGFAGGLAGVGQDDQGNPTVDPTTAVLGAAAGTLAAGKGGRWGQIASEVSREAVRLAERMGADARVGQDLGATVRGLPGEVGSHVKPTAAGGPASAIDKFQAIHYASMLSDWAGRTADVGTGVVKSFERPLVTLLGGRPARAAADVSAMVRALPGAIGQFAETYKAGVPQLGQGRAQVRTRPIGGPIGRVLTAPLDFMQAADDATKFVNIAGAAASEAVRLADRLKGDPVEYLRYPTEQMLERVLGKVQAVTYSQPLAEGSIAKWVSDGRNLKGVNGVIVSFLVPFATTSVNIMRAGVHDLARGLVLPGLGEAVYKGAVKGDAEAARDAVGRTAIAFAAMAGLASLAVQGNITGTGPKDPQAKRALMDTGWQPQSIRVGDRYVSYANLGEMVIPATTVATFWENYAAAGKPDPAAIEQMWPVVTESAGRIAGAMSDMSYLRGIASWFSAAASGDVSHLRQLGQVASGLVPLGGAVGHVERLVDPEQRVSKTPLEQVAARVPGLSGDLPETNDVFGRPRAPGENDTLAQAVSPLRTQREKPAPADAFLRGLIQSHQKITLPQAPKDITIPSRKGPGLKITLSPREQQAFQRATGRVFKQTIDDLLADRDFVAADRSTQAKAVSKAAEIARRAGQAEVLGAISDDALERRLTAAAPSP